ncbi:MAG: amino acid racemase [Aliifodinibius sp.]|nr:amino acid racemase [Fodinibius sp.]
MRKTAGIIGGMGPESTFELMRLVVENTPVQTEQDHIRMLVDNRPEIPDRTEFILGKGPSPVPLLQDSARELSRWGADFLAIACNTAHYFIKEIKEVVDIPVLNMLQLVRNKIERQFPPGTIIGLLATTGSLRVQLFHQYLKTYSILTPVDEIQENLVMEAIYGQRGIKAGGDFAANQQKILQALEHLKLSGPRCIIAGCTEVGLALKTNSIGIPILNPLFLLAEEIVKEAIPQVRVDG